MLKALKFTLDTDCFKNGYIYFMIYLPVLLKPFKKGKKYASAGNRTRINCLEGSYAGHYTTDADVRPGGRGCQSGTRLSMCACVGACLYVRVCVYMYGLCVVTRSE